MTDQLVTAIDDAITVTAARYDHVLELLAHEHDRLEQLAGMRDTAVRLAEFSSSPPLPPGAAAEPADTAGHHGAPACAPPLDELPAAAASPAASSSGHVPGPPARTTAPRAGGSGRDGLTEKQSALISAVNSLGQCTAAEVAAHVGRDDLPAVSQALQALRRRGLIGHNGKATNLARYVRNGGGSAGQPSQREKTEQAAAAARAPAGLNGSVEQRVELALKWAKTPLKFDAIVTRCKATSIERSQVQEALAYMEADGCAVCVDGRWSKTERLAEAA